MDEITAEAALDLLGVLAAAGLGVIAGLVVSVLISVVSRLVVRRHPSMQHLSRRAKLPQRVFLAVLGAGIGIALASYPPGGTEPVWRAGVLHIHLIIVMLLGAWLLTAVIFALEDSIRSRFEGIEATNHSRRVATQTQMLRRLGVATVWLVAVAAVLYSFESFRGIGTSLFASAGLVSIVAGLAAQSTLGNLFAGLQIAFTDSLRVGDVVVANATQCTVEEVTLTYVVLRIWDGRRMILPSSHFTTTPFENWTRRAENNLLGTVEWDLDWLAPVEAMRVELQWIVETNDLWDGRTVGLQVTESTGGTMRVRAVLSASNAGDLWDLRCHVREEMVEWLRRNALYALPRTRLEPETTPAPPVEEVQEFVEELQRQYAAEKSREETTGADSALLVVDESDTQRLRREAEARHARREAERADRRAARAHPGGLAGREDFLLPVPTSGATEVIRESILAQAGRLRSAEARLYSGSPEAEERARLLEGPTPEDMAEREAVARRREQGPVTETIQKEDK